MLGGAMSTNLSGIGARDLNTLLKLCDKFTVVDKEVEKKVSDVASQTLRESYEKVSPGFNFVYKGKKFSIANVEIRSTTAKKSWLTRIFDFFFPPKDAEKEQLQDLYEKVTSGIKAEKEQRSAKDLLPKKASLIDAHIEKLEHLETFLKVKLQIKDIIAPKPLEEVKTPESAPIHATKPSEAKTPAPLPEPTKPETQEIEKLREEVPSDAPPAPPPPPPPSAAPERTAPALDLSGLLSPKLKQFSGEKPPLPKSEFLSTLEEKEKRRADKAEGKEVSLSEKEKKEALYLQKINTKIGASNLHPSAKKLGLQALIHVITSNFDELDLKKSFFQTEEEKKIFCEILGVTPSALEGLLNPKNAEPRFQTSRFPALAQEILKPETNLEGPDAVRKFQKLDCFLKFLTSDEGCVEQLQPLFEKQATVIHVKESLRARFEKIRSDLLDDKNARTAAITKDHKNKIVEIFSAEERRLQNMVDLSPGEVDSFIGDFAQCIEDLKIVNEKIKTLNLDSKDPQLSPLYTAPSAGLSPLFVVEFPLLANNRSSLKTLIQETKNRIEEQIELGNAYRSLVSSKIDATYFAPLIAAIDTFKKIAFGPNRKPEYTYERFSTQLVQFSKAAALSQQVPPNLRSLLPQQFDPTSIAIYNEILEIVTKDPYFKDFTDACRVNEQQLLEYQHAKDFVENVKTLGTPLADQYNTCTESIASLSEEKAFLPLVFEFTKLTRQAEEGRISFLTVEAMVPKYAEAFRLASNLQEKAKKKFAEIAKEIANFDDYLTFLKAISGEKYHEKAVKSACTEYEKSVKKRKGDLASLPIAEFAKHYGKDKSPFTPISLPTGPLSLPKHESGYSDFIKSYNSLLSILDRKEPQFVRLAGYVSSLLKKIQSHQLSPMDVLDLTMQLRRVMVGTEEVTRKAFSLRPYLYQCLPLDFSDLDAYRKVLNSMAEDKFLHACDTIERKKDDLKTKLRSQAKSSGLGGKAANPRSKDSGPLLEDIRSASSQNLKRTKSIADIEAELEQKRVIAQKKPIAATPSLYNSLGAVIQAGSSDEESDAEASGPQAFANQAKDAFERAQKSLAKAKELVRAGKMVELQKEVAEVARFGKAATKAAEGAEEAEQDEWKEPSAGAEQAVQEAKKYATMAMNLAQEAKAILDDATRPT
jgi:hypothetical protein